MIHHVLLPREGLITDLTLVRRLARMTSRMVVQVFLTTKRFCTNVALVWFVHTMSFRMAFQTGCIRKHMITYVTSEHGVVVQMTFAVSTQLCAVWKCPATNLKTNNVTTIYFFNIVGYPDCEFLANKRPFPSTNSGPHKLTVSHPSHGINYYYRWVWDRPLGRLTILYIGTALLAVILLYHWLFTLFQRHLRDLDYTNNFFDSVSFSSLQSPTIYPFTSFSSSLLHSGSFCKSMSGCHLKWDHFRQYDSHL